MASLALFVAIKAMPEDPIALKFGKHPDPQLIVQERERLGLDRPWLSQYLSFNKQFVSGDWGESLLTGRASLEDVGLFFPATIELGLLALAVGCFAGASIALYARISETRVSKTIALSLGNVGLTVPIFWIGLLLLVLGALWLGWFPAGGRFDLMLVPPKAITGLLLLDSLIAGDAASFSAALRHLVLPSCCLAVFPAASVSSVLYARLGEPSIEALYVSLKARGYGNARIVFSHLLRVASAPVITVIGTTFGALLGGAFLTETVFSWPGIGRYLVSAIIERDVFIARNVLMMLILLVFVVAFLSDILAQWMDPFESEKEEET